MDWSAIHLFFSAETKVKKSSEPLLTNKN